MARLNVPTAVACLLFLAFATARAILVPLTYDEAATYLRYIGTPLLSIFSFDLATNHFLNTLLTKLCWLAGGDREIVLRLPNLIGYGVYLWWSVRILNGLSRRAIAFMGFLLLNLNLYVLQYFSLSRGYGLSLAFLMGAFFFLIRFLRQLADGVSETRDLSRALFLACGAVIANFALLNVYAAVFAVGLIALVAFKAVSGGTPPAPLAARRPDRTSRRSVAWLALVAVVFTIVVFSQDIGMSDTLYEPIEVALSGLDEVQLNTVTVSQVNIRGRVSQLSREGGSSVWRTVRRNAVAGLHIDLPADIARHLGAIDVSLGNRRFRRNQEHDGGWTSHGVGGARAFDTASSLSLPKPWMPTLQSIINWAGDLPYAVSLTQYTVVALSLVAALAILLDAIGWYVVRARLMAAEQWSSLTASVLWLVALAGPPMYLLNRGSLLYFGGTGGLVQETFYSIIEASFYERMYAARQTPLVFDVVVGTLVVFGVAFVLSVRRRSLRAALPCAGLVGIMLLTTMASVAERFILHTPYALERTALFYIPLYVLFLTFLCETIADLGAAGATAATSLLALVVSASMYHFATTANVRYTLEWRKDAATKAMMEDLGRLVAAERGPGARVVLGIDWFYSTVAAFYAGRTSAAGIDVVVLPARVDFSYVDEALHRGERLDVLRRYPVSGSLLARKQPPR